MEEIVQAHAPADLLPGGIYPSARWIEGWMDTKAGLGPLEKSQFIIHAAFKPRNAQPAA